MNLSTLFLVFKFHTHFHEITICTIKGIGMLMSIFAEKLYILNILKREQNMIKHILSFLLGTFVMIIGYVWVIPYTLEAIDSNVSYITNHKKYFSKLYEYDINLWIIAMLIFCILLRFLFLYSSYPIIRKIKALL